MKKVVLAVLLIGIAVILGAPFANGVLMERVVRQACSDINSMYADAGQDLSVEITDYQRGYRTSRIKWKIMLGRHEKLYGIKEIIVVDEAKHGLTGVISKSSLAENLWFADLVGKQLDGKNPVDITTRCNLLGHIDSMVALDAFSVQSGGDLLTIKPGKITTTFSKGLKSIASQGSWDGFTVGDQIDLGGISFEANMEMVSTYIWNGDGSFTVAYAKAMAEQPPVDVSNFKCGFTMDFEESGNTVSVGADYGVDRFVTGEQRIEDAFVRIGVNRIDARGYENLVKVYTQILNASMSTMAQAQDDPEKMQAAMQKQMLSNGMQLMAAFEKILKNGLEIRISDLKASLPQGQITGRIALGLKKDMTMAQFIPIIGQPSLALDIFSLQSDMRLPAVLAGDDPRWFTPLYPGMQTGLFEKNGDHMVHNAETREGKLYLNGQEVILN
ncbi:MAG: DUF945 family protein [Desulfobacteraceae bacterium]